MSIFRRGLQIPFLTGAWILGATLMGVYAWKLWDIQQDEVALHRKAVDLAAHIGRIMQLDEVLTMSARMAAASGDASYEARYRRFEPELDRVIKETMAHVPLPSSLRDTQQTDEANQRLVEMEHRSFDLDHERRSNDEQVVLTSPEYLRQKALYSQGMRSVFTALQTAQEEHEQRVNRVERLLQAVGILGALVVLVGGILSVQAVMARRQAEERLRQAHDRLELQVQERTAELAQANQMLTAELSARKRV